MEGASAVVAFVQLGLSLATTLNTYIADVRHGRDDIANLANEIEATVSHAQELEKLIQENKTTSRWSAHGLFLAQKCLKDCQDVIQRLSALLRRSGGTPTGTGPFGNSLENGDSKLLVSRTDVDISKFSRLSWPLYKPQLEYLKQELQKIKIEMLLALNTYQVNATSKTEERKAIVERIVALWRSRTIARRELVLCGRRLERPNRRRTDGYRDAPDQRGGFEYREGRRDISRSRSRSMTPPIYTESPIRERGRRSTDDFKDRPRGERPYEGPEGPYHDYNYDEEYESLPFAPAPEEPTRESPVKRAVDYFFQFALGPNEDATSTQQNITSLWDKYKNDPAALKRLLKAVNSMPSSKPVNTIPFILRDPTRPDGAAFTWALRIWKSSQGNTVHPVDYPFQLLSKRLAREEHKSAKPGSLDLHVFATLASLPSAYRTMINRWLTPNPHSRHYWMLLLLDPVYEVSKEYDSWTKRLSKCFSRTREDKSKEREPTTVLAVFKRCIQPDARSSRDYSPERRGLDSAVKLGRKLAPALAGALASTLRDRRHGQQQGPRSRTPSPAPSDRGRRSRRRPQPYYRSRSRSPRPWRSDINGNAHGPGPANGPARYDYEMSDTEEPAGDEELADKIMTQYTGHYSRIGGGAEPPQRPNGRISEVTDDEDE